MVYEVRYKWYNVKLAPHIGVYDLQREELQVVQDLCITRSS